VHTPASLVAIPLLVGAATGLLVPATGFELLALRLAGSALLALIAACGSFAMDDETLPWAAIVTGCALAGLSLGMSGAKEVYRPPLLAWFEARDLAARGEPVAITGVLREDAAPTPVGVSLIVDVSMVGAVPSRGGVRLSVIGSSAGNGIAEWRAGRTVVMPAVLRVPTMYGDPGVPDEVRSLARRGIVLIGTVKSAALVDVLSRGSPLDEASSAARHWARVRLADYVGCWSPESGAIASAILIGDRSGLSDEDQRRLQEAGTYHVIAISGGNIAVLTGILLGAMRMVRLHPRVAPAICVVILLLYGRLTGFSPSVARAVVGACVYLWGRILDHRGPALNALSVAAIMAVAVSPVTAFDPGFVLSFGATLGILLGASRMLSAMTASRGPQHRRSVAVRVTTALAALLVATASAELALFPVSAVVFSRVTFAGLVLNFAAIPLMAVVQAASMVTLAAAPLTGHIPGAAGYVTHVAAYWLTHSARLVDLAPWLARDVSPPSWALVAAYYTCCAACLVGGRFVRVAVAGLTVCGGVILAGAAPLTASSVPPHPGKLRVVFLDVGQGDSTMVGMPDGRMMVIDAGGVAGSTFDIGEHVVAPALRAFGLRA
jgi:competence protein ComEC